VLLVVALAVVVAWPPKDGTSLGVTFVRWAVDPFDALPLRPPGLGLAEGDDPAVVEMHDRIIQQYDAAYQKGGWTRRRLLLKAAAEPFDPATERQVLTAVAVLTAFLTVRLLLSSSTSRRR
jgi:hypothetical protein